MRPVAVVPEPEVQRRRREDRAAEGAEGIGCGEGVCPSARGRGVRGGCTPSAENFSIFQLKKAYFWCILAAIFLHLMNLN